MRHRPAMPAIARFGAAFLVMAAGLLVFRVAQLEIDATVRFETPLDRAIPFLPWTIWCYLLFFLYLPTMGALATPARFWSGIAACHLAFAVALATYAVLPASCTRPDPSAIGGTAERAIFTFIQRRDLPHNSLPSMHVAATWIACWMAWPSRWRWLAAAVAAAISASTLTTKQHHLVDVAAGLALAAAAITAALPFAARLAAWAAQPSPKTPRADAGAD